MRMICSRSRLSRSTTLPGIIVQVQVGGAQFLVFGPGPGGAGDQEEVEINGRRRRERLQAAAAGQIQVAGEIPPDQDVVAVFRKVYEPGYPGVGEFQAGVLFPPAGEPLRPQVDGDLQTRFGEWTLMATCKDLVCMAGDANENFLYSAIQINYYIKIWPSVKNLGKVRRLIRRLVLAAREQPEKGDSNCPAAKLSMLLQLRLINDKVGKIHPKENV